MDPYNDDDFVALVECHCCSWSGYEDEVTIEGRCPDCGARFGSYMEGRTPSGGGITR